MGEPESLDTDEPLARHVARHDYDRLIMLSDGVFAIAMTLLVLEVKPEPGPGSLLARLTPSLSGFALSFGITAVFWSTHKRLFARLQRVDGRLTALVVLLLGLVALIPAATSLILQEGPSGEARILYLALMGLIGLVQAGAWGYAAIIARLVHPGLTMRSRLVAVISNAVLPIALSGLSLYSAGTGSLAAVALATAAGIALLVGRRWLAGGAVRPPPSEAPAARS